MGPLTLAVDSKSSCIFSSDASNGKARNLQLETKRFFASVSTGEDKPFDFLRIFFEGVIAGGTAGVVVETALYPIDTIKTRLQAARGGGEIILKGLYSGLAGNLVGVLPASAMFVGVYEPTKQKLLKIFPDNLSVVAHLDQAVWSSFPSPHKLSGVPPLYYVRTTRLANTDLPKRLTAF